MPSFQIPEYLREYTDQNAVVEVEAGDLNDAFEHLFTAYPNLRSQVISPEGGVRPFIMVFVGKFHVNGGIAQKTELKKDDVISLLVNLAGG